MSPFEAAGVEPDASKRPGEPVRFSASYLARLAAIGRTPETLAAEHEAEMRAEYPEAARPVTGAADAE